MNTPLHLRSLQGRIVALVLGVVALLWLAAAVLTWFDTGRELGELLDGHLAQAAALLVAQQSREIDDDALAEAPGLHPDAPRVAFQVWHEGQMVLRSANAPVQPMSARESGFETRDIDGLTWRVFASHGAARDVQVYVGERLDARDHILVAISRNVVAPLALVLPLLALAAWWAVRTGLAPLRRLSRQLAARAPRSLEAVTLDHAPDEMEPLLDALNDLLARMAATLESERRFTADAAHELRTPIAAIRIQAQVALNAGVAAERVHALQATIAGCDRASHLVEQLLQLARLEAAPKPPAPLDLAALTQAVLAQVSPAALHRGQNLELEAPSACPVLGDEVLLGALVRNLVDNAIRYGGQGARVHVRLDGGAAPRLRIEDSGPGLSAEARRRLGERFFRVLGSDEAGSGLGWSIVQRIARVHGLAVSVADSAQLGGLAVQVDWPGH